MGLAQAAKGQTPSMDWGTIAELPNEHGFAGMFAGVNEAGLWVAGGANFPESKPWEGGTKQWSQTIYHLANISGTWQVHGVLREPRGYGATISLDGQVIAIGGSSATKHYASCEVIAETGKANPPLRVWPDLPAPRANMACVVLGKKIFLLGGIETPQATRCAPDFFCLDVAAMEQGWQTLERFPGPARMFAMMGTDGEQIFVFGGASLASDDEGKPRRTYLNDVWCYRPGHGWSSRTTMPSPRAAAPSPLPSLAHQLVIFSGDDGEHIDFQPLGDHPGFPRDALWYDTRQDRWTKLPLPDRTLRWSRATAPWVFWNDRWFLISGETRPGVRTPQNLSLKLFPPGSIPHE